LGGPATPAAVHLRHRDCPIGNIVTGSRRQRPKTGTATAGRGVAITNAPSGVAAQGRLTKVPKGAAVGAAVRTDPRPLRDYRDFPRT